MGTGPRRARRSGSVGPRAPTGGGGFPWPAGAPGCGAPAPGGHRPHGQPRKSPLLSQRPDPTRSASRTPSRGGASLSVPAPVRAIRRSPRAAAGGHAGLPGRLCAVGPAWPHPPRHGSGHGSAAQSASGHRVFQLSLRALFQLLRNGVDLGPEGRIPAYGGGLFSTVRDANSPFPDFDDLTLGDATVAQILDLLTHVHTRRGKVTLSYRELDVEQLGALYEGLLERAVDYVDERIGPLWRIRLDGDLVLVTEDQLADLCRRRGEAGAEVPDEGSEADDDEDNETEAEEVGEEEEEAEVAASSGKKKPIRVLPAATGAPNPIPVGSVILRPGLGRKQSGSYYTNSAFVEYLVREAIDPLAEGKRPEEILQLAV